MIKVGDSLPSVTLSEFVAVEGNGCSLGPNAFDVAKEAAGKTVALFAVPGAFTPTCTLNHLPGYIDNFNKLVEKGIDDVAVVSVNDWHVMGAWAQASGAFGKIHFFADWDASFSKALGLDIDLSGGGLGVRSKRYSALIEDGVVKSLDIEENPGVATVSSAEAMLEKL